MKNLTLDNALEICQKNSAFVHKESSYKDVKLHSFAYDLADYGDFNNPIPGSGLQAWEMRGVSFVEYPDGTVKKYKMMDKFYSFGETLGWMEKDLSGWKLKSTTEKLDGSLIRFIPVYDELLAKSKNSFFGPTCKNAQELFSKNHENFTKELIEQGLSSIFELLSQEIVVQNQKPELKLIKIIREEDGYIVEPKEYEDLIFKYEIPCTNTYNFTLDEIKKYQTEISGIEGWVSLFEKDGVQKLVKFKTDWYENMHDLTFEGRFANDVIVNAIIKEHIDDILPRIRSEEARNYIENVKTIIVETYKKTYEETVDFLNQAQKTSDLAAFRKEYFKNNQEPLMNAKGILMKDPHCDEDKIRATIKSVMLNLTKKNSQAIEFINYFAKKQNKEFRAFNIDKEKMLFWRGLTDENGEYLVKY